MSDSPTPSKSAEERIADYWATDRKIDKPLSWLEHPVLVRNVFRRIGGHEGISGPSWFHNKYLGQRIELALSLGCGTGAFERDGIRANMARAFHAHDISPGAIATAKAEAEKIGFGHRIEYSVMNLDDAQFPEAAYDVAFGLMAVHHVFRLEDLFKKIRAALKPHGLLYLDEYIGPSRFQTPPEVTALINSIRDRLPKELLTSLFAKDGSPIGRYAPSPVEHFEATDPSEAIRSAEIVPQLSMYFDILEYRPYGGALLHMLLSGIVGNFDPNDAKDVALLEMLALLEETLEAFGVIEPEFAVIVARPKRSATPPG